ncbi:carboxypeptidase-like regulatory domain-containing protein [Frateuria terrea]|uniref:Carboxypeptidase regulatory-like domain-containing protein n=1 Tax=Frateuria terrea TaxID=529704 RepID=A0A1H6UN11_9GAMM|nr:carboxypeptidase-like regulatory domain-containing protein [Frateuria terrea]SEI91137.1 Carboxypeptidase regulatory-like domain-containing protein [Frateuria terrea]SFP36107.1 Carboxypeptidase regulatory-like domain-containing protein [Frateuria terrea]
MKTIHSIHAGSVRRVLSARSFALAVALAVCGLAGTSAVYAQSTSGEVFGKAPAGDSVLAKSMTNGSQREVQVDAKGRYMIKSLPVGVYSVTLSENGQPVAKHLNVPVVVGRGIQVNFDGAASAAGTN